MIKSRMFSPSGGLEKDKVLGNKERMNKIAQIWKEERLVFLGFENYVLPIYNRLQVNWGCDLSEAFRESDKWLNSSIKWKGVVGWVKDSLWTRLVFTIDSFTSWLISPTIHWSGYTHNAMISCWAINLSKTTAAIIMNIR